MQKRKTALVWATGGVFVIWPAAGVRKSQAVPKISTTTGVIQYPSHGQTGMIEKVFLCQKLSLDLATVKTIETSADAHGAWEITLNLVPLVHGDAAATGAA